MQSNRKKPFFNVSVRGGTERNGLTFADVGYKLILAWSWDLWLIDCKKGGLKSNKKMHYNDKLLSSIFA